MPIDASPEQSTDVSTRVATGCGYDSYTGSVRRTVVDLSVPAAIGSHGLNLIRTYSSMTPWASGWTFYPGWRMEGKPFSGDGYIVYFPDGRVAKFKPPRSTQTGETAWRAAAGTNERLFLQSTNQYVGTADLWLEDGTRVHFDRSTELSGNDQYPIDYFTLAYWADPYGQITTFSYEQIPGTFELHDIRVKRVTDPSQRYLEYSYDAASGVFPSQVNASNGQSVRYTWTPWNSTVGRQLERADYSDGTFATYTYERVPIIGSDGRAGTLPMLITAQDTRAVGPMRAIRYEYTPNPVKDFPGEIKAERHLADNAAVSTFSHNSGRTVSTDTRGDTRSRTFNLQKVGGTPLVMSKSDFKGRLEYFYYDANNYLRQFNNRRGYPTTYINEPILGKPTRITNPDQTYRLYNYSNAFKPYFVSSVRDENGWYSSYLRDGNNRIYEIDFPNGAVETFAYNGFGQVITRRRTNGVYDAYDHFEYDPTGRLTKRWDPTPLSSYPPASTVPFTSYTYYTSADIWQWTDRIRTMTDQLGRVTVYEYDRGADGLQCAGRGLVTRISYPGDTHNGTLPYGTSQSFGYDAYGNRTSVTDELGHTTRYEYDDYNRVTKVTNHLNQATTTSYALDWVNPYLQTNATIKYVVSPMNKNVVYDYDENLRKIDQVAALGTPDEAWTLFETDEVGNLTKTTDSRFKVTSYGYDNRNRRTSATNIELNETTTFGYDNVGNKTRETRPDGSFQSWDYDGMNRLWHAYEWRFTDPPTAGQTTTYGRDLAGNVRTITDTKGAVYRYDYDLKNLKISETYPVDATGVSRTRAYHYDDAGNLDYMKNPANQYKHVVFDARNRPIHSWWDGTAEEVGTDYDAAGRVTLKWTNQWETSVYFGYDDANRKIWEDQTVSGYLTRRVETPVDADGNRTSLGVGGYYLIRYDYTQRNQLSHIYGGGWEPWFNYSYDAAGNMTKRQGVLGGTNDSINAPTEWYDALNRPTAWENTKAGDVWFARSHYQYNKAGREEATWRDEQSSKGERYWYTANGQLSVAEYNADNVWVYPQNWDRWVGYNYTPDMLNRSSVNDSGSITNYTFSPLNQYTAVNGETLYHDSNFNISLHSGWFYYYDAENRLTKVSDWTGAVLLRNTYDGLGRCVKREGYHWGGSMLLSTYDGWNPIVEWDGGGNFQAWNIYGARADEILWRYENGVGHLRYHHDKQGSVTTLLDYWGNVIEKYSYDAFGQPRVTDANGGGARTWSNYRNRFMFTGREYYPFLWLYDYRNRWYDMNLGRFLQPDSIGFDAGDTNLFRYCGDDPVDKTDPMGLQAAPSMRFYDQPLFPPYPERTVVEKFTTTERPRIDTLIPTRVHWEVTRQDFLVPKITVPIYDKNGRFTGKREDRPKDAAFTESRISATQHGPHNFNLRWDFDLQFRADLGVKWQAFVIAREPDHIHEIVGGAKNSPYTRNGIIAAAKQGLPALQDRAESMRHNWTMTSGAQDLFGRHTLRENGIDVPLNQ